MRPTLPLLALLLSLAFPPLAAAQTTCYDNGPLANSIGTGPGGGDQSLLVGDETTFGYGAQAPPTDNEMADDFVAASGCTSLKGAVLYTYQTGATAPSITGASVNVYGSDSSGMPDPNNVVCSTTTLAGPVTFTNTYRGTDTARRIQRVEVNFPAGCRLTAGQRYWIGAQFTGTGVSGPWYPPVPRPLGSTTCPPVNGYPAHQNLGGAGFTPIANGSCHVDFPFQLLGATDGCGLTLGIASAALSPTEVYPGGSVTISGSIANNSNLPQNAALTLDYERVGGGPSGTLPLAEGAVPPGIVPFSVTRRVPANAPAGAYSLLLRLTEQVYGETCSLWPLMLTVTTAASDPSGVENGEVFEADTPAENPFASASAAGLTGTHALSEAAPNPSPGMTALTLSVTESQAVRVEVIDALGRRVALLHNGAMATGTEHRLVFDGSSLPSGVYVVRAVGEAFADTRVLTLTR